MRDEMALFAFCSWTWEFGRCFVSAICNIIR